MSDLIIPTKKQTPGELNKSYLERGVRKLLDQKFQRSDLFQVWSEKHIYSKDADALIFEQVKGRLPEIVEVRFTGEWICDISETLTPDQAYDRILQGLHGLKAKRERILKRKERSGGLS